MNPEKTEINEIGVNKASSIKEDLTKYVLLLEDTLSSYGVAARVAVVDKREKEIAFCVDLAVGTRISDLENLKREIALSLASPSGLVEIAGPIPNTHWMEILLPRKINPGKVVKYKILKVRVTSKKSIGNEVESLISGMARWVRDKMNWIVERLA